MTGPAWRESSSKLARAAERKRRALLRPGSASRTWPPAASEPGEQARQRVGVLGRVADVGGQDEVERAALGELVAVLGPGDVGDLAGRLVERQRVGGEGDGVGRAVGGEHRRAGAGGDDARRAEPAAELEHAGAGGRRIGGERLRQRVPARPRPRPERHGPARRALVVAQRLPVGGQQQVDARDLAHRDGEQRGGQVGDRDAPQARELLGQRRPDGRQRPVAVHASSVPLPGTLRRMPDDRPDEPLVAIVEIPKGSSNKYEWDEELGAIKLDRLLFASLGYPTDYGFFKDTLAADGDPLDVMIVVSEPTFPGCRIEVKPVALFRMRDENAEDNKILCVPFSDPNWSHVEQLDDLPMTLRDEISHFFSIYKTPEWKVVKVDGWYHREEALESIERAQKRFRDKQG